MGDGPLNFKNMEDFLTHLETQGIYIGPHAGESLADLIRMMKVRLAKLEKVADAARNAEAVTIILRTEAWPEGDLFLHGSPVAGRTIPLASLKRIRAAGDELAEALADLDKE